MLRIAPEEVRALPLDNIPAHSDAEKLVSADGKIQTTFLSPNTTSIIQPMDFGVIVALLTVFVSGNIWMKSWWLLRRKKI